MATSKKEVATQDSSNKVALQQIADRTNGMDVSNVAELKNLMQMAKHVDNEELTKVGGAAYAELEDGETYMFIYNGIVPNAMKSMKEGATDTDFVDAVNLTNEQGEETVNADIVMLSTARKLDAQGKKPPYLIKVFVDGMKGDKGRQYKNLQIWSYAK
jgi:hypothetical protein